ncbi:MAG: DUF72 domain-containing protein [Candidatus Helarchaeota archaeon]
MKKFILGCSGWSYDDWKGTFYNHDIKSSDMLYFYSKIFNAVEINTTFYNIPRLEYVQRWMKKTPDHFIFAVKFPKQVTHEKLFRNEVSDKDIIPISKILNALKPKIGPILIQFRPKFEINLSKLETLFSLLPDQYRYTVEFRHSSWLTNSTFQLLEKYNIAFCIVDEPYKSKKNLIPPVIRITSDFTYIRWHGLNENHWYDYLYSDDQLKNWKKNIETISDSVKKVYGFFNNHPNGQAPTNCRRLLELLGEKTRNPRSFSIRKGKIMKPRKTLDKYF